jgi:hypothetical protein
MSPCVLSLLLACLATAAAQTYTNENLPGVTAYSAWSGAPSASSYSPYTTPFTAVTPTAGAAPGAGGCTGVGGTCLPVSVAGSSSAGYWLTRGGAPYWFKCVRDVALRAARALSQRVLGNNKIARACARVRGCLRATRTRAPRGAAPRRGGRSCGRARASGRRTRRQALPNAARAAFETAHSSSWFGSAAARGALPTTRALPAPARRTARSQLTPPCARAAQGRRHLARLVCEHGAWRRLVRPEPGQCVEHHVHAHAELRRHEHAHLHDRGRLPQHRGMHRLHLHVRWRREGDDDGADVRHVRCVQPPATRL